MVIKGKVDDWRFHRLAAWRIVTAFVGQNNIPSEKAMYDLPFDFEVKDAPMIDPTELYNNASKELSNFIWPSKAPSKN